MYGQTPLLDHVHNPHLEVVRGDVRDDALLKQSMADADILIPLACLTGAPLCAQDPVGAKTIIVDAVASMLEQRSSQQLVLYPTTNSGYGIGESDAHCTEETPLRPISLYGKLKVEAEERILAAGNSATLRLATAFGMSPRMRLDLLVNDFTFRAVNDRFIVLFEAHFKRNFIHVRDIAQGFSHLLDHFDEMRGQAYNLGLDDANLNKAELCEAIRKYVPEFVWHEAPVGEDPDKRNYIVSNAKIAKTGFVPSMSLDAGIQELVKGYEIIRRNQHANV